MAISFSRITGLALLSAALCLPAALPAAAGGGGGSSAGSMRDSVTGYQCVSLTCDALRLPNANCVCVKVNPGEQDVRKLHLSCSTFYFGKHSSCPVKPQYGIED